MVQGIGTIHPRCRPSHSTLEQAEVANADCIYANTRLIVAAVLRGLVDCTACLPRSILPDGSAAKHHVSIAIGRRFCRAPQSALEMPMTTLDTMLASISERSTAEELRSIMHFLGECAAKRETRTLERFHDRMQRLWRTAPADSWLRGFVEGACRCLDGYFASIEPTERMEQLAREVDEEPLWREILLTLWNHQELNQVGIGTALAKRPVQIPKSKTAISIALDCLRERELVEYMPTPVRRERVHALTRRGQDLCTKLVGAAASRAAGSPKLAQGTESLTPSIPTATALQPKASRAQGAERAAPPASDGPGRHMRVAATRTRGS